MADLFSYENYRTYLADYYAEQKQSKPYFSYRYFSELAGINSSAFLLHIINGTRNLSKSTVLKVSKALGHTDSERDYFENLVFFNQAKTVAEKTSFYTAVLSARKPMDVTTIEAEQYEFYSKWYHSVIREMVNILTVTDDYHSLAKKLRPHISPREAESSIKLLVRLGFIVKNEEGRFVQSKSTIKAIPSSLDSVLMIKKFQLSMLEMAMLSYDVTSTKETLCASTTFSISRETFELFKLKTRTFRQELQEIASLDTNPEQVFQFTFNLFPLTGLEGEK